MSDFFGNIFASGAQTTVSVWKFLLCIGISLILGAAYAVSYSFRNRVTRSLSSALILLPCAVCMVILMVSGNIGIGVAVAGAFSLVRFRSAQGNAKDICAIFTSMCSGLIAGVGYIGYAVLFTLIMCAVIVAVNLISELNYGKSNGMTLKITVPEDLNYSDALDEVIQKYTTSNTLVQVKTTGMGSMYRLTYDVNLNAGCNTQEFIDKLRTRNGNLEIMLMRRSDGDNNL